MLARYSPLLLPIPHLKPDQLQYIHPAEYNQGTIYAKSFSGTSRNQDLLLCAGVFSVRRFLYPVANGLFLLIFWFVQGLSDR